MRQPAFYFLGVLLILVVGQAVASPAPPPNRGTIEGDVIDAETGHSVPWATIALVDGFTRLLADSAGSFTLAGLLPGSYVVRITHVGYQTKVTAAVEVVAGETSRIHVTLTPDPATVKTIVVSPGRFNLGAEPVTHQTLSREEITSVPQLADDFFRSTIRLPGMAGNDFSTKFTVRGGEYEEVLVTLDGLEIHEPFHMKDIDGGAISIIDGSTIQGVDLMTGGFPAQYGDKMSGVYGIRSFSPPPEKTSLSAGISLINMRALARGPLANGKGSWLASVRRGYIDVALKLAAGDTEMQPRYYDLFGKVNYQLGRNHMLAAHVLHAKDDFSYIGTGDDSNDTLLADYSNSYVWLRLHSSYHPRLNSQTILSIGQLTRSRHGQQYNTGNDWLEHSVFDEADSRFLGFKTDFEFEATDEVLLQWGFDSRWLWSEYDYDSRRYIYGYQVTPAGAIPYLARVDTTATMTEPKGTRLGGYLSTRFNFGKPFTGEVGWRYDRADYTGDDLISPRVAGVYRFNPWTSVRAAWGKYYQIEGIHEMAVADAETDFFPAQLAEHYVAGLEHRFLSGTEARLELYYKKYKRLRPDHRNSQNPIELFPEHENDRQVVYRQSAFSKGVEIYVKRDVGSRVSWWASYSFARVEEKLDSLYYTLPDVSDYFGETLNSPRDLTHTFYCDVAYRPSPNWQLNAAFQYHTGWPRTDVRLVRVQTSPGEYVNFINAGREWSARFEPFHRLDVRLSRHFRIGQGRLKLFVELLNVYNRKNVRTYSYTVIETPDTAYVSTQPDEYWFGLMPSFGVSYEVGI